MEAIARVPLGPQVNGMEDLKKFLIMEKRDQVAENVLRRLLSYGIGRELTAQPFVVEELLQEFCQGHRLLDSRYSVYK